MPILKLDTLKINKEWQVLNLANPTNINVYSQGLFPLGFEEDSDTTFQFLIFGGFKRYSTNCTWVFTTNLDDFKKSEISLQSPLLAKDQFF